VRYRDLDAMIAAVWLELAGPDLSLMDLDWEIDPPTMAAELHRSLITAAYAIVTFWRPLPEDDEVVSVQVYMPLGRILTGAVVRDQMRGALGLIEAEMVARAAVRAREMLVKDP
jgi:hypothetical protein